MPRGAKRPLEGSSGSTAKRFCSVGEAIPFELKGPPSSLGKSKSTSPKRTATLPLSQDASATPLGDQGVHQGGGDMGKWPIRSTTSFPL